MAVEIKDRPMISGRLIATSPQKVAFYDKTSGEHVVFGGINRVIRIETEQTGRPILQTRIELGDGSAMTFRSDKGVLAVFK